MSANKVILVGRIGNDIDLRYTQGGQAVTDLSIATSRGWTDKNGQRQSKTTWTRVVVWNKQAENCKRYLSKGRQVYIEGHLENRKWEDTRDHITRYATDVIAEVVQFLGDKPVGENSQNSSSNEGQGRENTPQESNEAGAAEQAAAEQEEVEQQLALNIDIPC